MQTQSKWFSCSLFECSNSWKLLVLLGLIALPDFMFAAGDADQSLAAIETAAESLKGHIFSKPIRLVVLIFAGFAGGIQSGMASSMKPFLLSMSIGVLFFFAPKIIDLIASFG